MLENNVSNHSEVGNVANSSESIEKKEVDNEVPETIVSRCQCFSFSRISNDNLKDRLRYIADKENINDDIVFEMELIKQVVKEIRRYNDVKVYRMFEDFIIGAIDGRETSKEAHKMLRDLAVECGFEEEFDKADKNAKVYGPRDCNVVVYFNMIKCDRDGHSIITTPDFTKGEYDVAVADCECDVRNLFDWSIYTPPKAILRNLWHVTFGDSVGNMEELVFQNVKEPDSSRHPRQRRFPPPSSCRKQKKY